MVIIVFRAVSILMCFVEQKQPVSHIKCAEHCIEKKQQLPVSMSSKANKERSQFSTLAVPGGNNDNFCPTVNSIGSSPCICMCWA